MGYFGIPFRNGVPIGLGSVVSFGAQQFDPSELFVGGTAGAWYDPSDLTTLFTTSAGTTQCAMPGDGAAVSVGRMLDKSGNGNHAIAFNNTTARPELRARVNLLTYSEQFDNAAWVNASTAITANTAVAPNNTTTADTLTNLITGFAYFGRTAITPAASTDWSIAVKYSGSSQWFLMNFGAGATTAVWFDIQNGLVGTQASGSVGSIQALGNGWYRCTVRRTTSLGGDVYCACADADNSTTATAGKNVFIWGADLRPANIGANVPAYQRIADANTYDTSGFPLYLFFDGFDDGMTAASYPVSANPTLCSGNRYLGGGGNAILAYTANPSLGLYTWGTAQAARGFNTWVGDTWGVANSYIASTLVETAYFFNGNPNSSGVSYFLNGTQQSLSQVRGTSDSRTMVNGLQIGYAGLTNVQLFFGNFYSIVSVNKILSSSERIALEQWVAGKTGIVIP